MSCILGIDPGVTGAVAFYFPEAPSRIAVDDVPVAGGEISAPHLASLIRLYSPSMAVIEKVNAFPGQGVSSVFNFGRSYGDVRGVVGALNIPLHFVSPQKWKKHFNLSSDKDMSRMLAIRMFPSVAEHFKLKRHHGRAEAALIALYGAENIFNRSAA
jgi:crossover junction endodeoxyribonuclease RuvC